jgi:anthranilate phosphoribosyltransferase
MSGDLVDLKQLIAHVASGRTLDRGQAETAFDIIMSGNATPSQMGGFLMALRVRGETVEEVTGAASIMRAKAQPVKAPKDAMDVVGTGGDASGTFNVSTASAIVVAACGVPVAKHGNRALSSKSGAADVLAALGVNLDAGYETVERAIREVGIGFMLAPRYHSAMRNVGPTRVELGTRTIFNLLGPLSNPAGVKRYLVGTFAKEWAEPMARVLGNLGAERAWVVHGLDGIDELTLTGPSHVSELKDGEVRSFTVSPDDAGLERAAPEALKGGDAEHNARAMTALLAGRPGGYRDFVLLNSAAALLIAGKAKTLPEGVAQAAKALDEGRAQRVLEGLVAITNDKP